MQEEVQRRRKRKTSMRKSQVHLIHHMSRRERDQIKVRRIKYKLSILNKIKVPILIVMILRSQGQKEANLKRLLKLISSKHNQQLQIPKIK